MRIRIRIYMEKEPELYAIYKAAGPALTRKIFRSAVEAYITGKKFDIEMPKIQLIDIPKLSPNPMFDFSVSEECRDALSALPGRSLTTFVKTLVRYYTFWDLTDAFNIPHKKEMYIKQDTEEHKPSKIIQPEFKPKAVEPKVIKEEVKVEEPVEEMENSDVNSLAALFGAIKTR